MKVTARTNFSTKKYAIEKLIAEIGSCYLNGLTGISVGHFKQNLSYIKDGYGALKNDKRLVVYARNQAQRATEYILNVAYNEKQ